VCCPKSVWPSISLWMNGLRAQWGNGVVLQSEELVRYVSPIAQAPAAPGVKTRYPNLDLLRLILSLEVVTLHVSWAWTFWHFNPPISPVPTFICLSGYLIPGSFEHSRGLGHFAWKRILRIGPPLICSFFLVLVLAGPSLVAPTIAYYLSAGLIDIKTGNGALWSLMVEEVLYAQHALVRILGKVWRPSVIVVLALLSLIAVWYLIESEQRRIPRAAFCFFAGNLAFLYRAQLLKISSIAYGLLATVLIITNSCIRMPAITAIALDGILCVVVVMLGCTLPQMRRPFPDISYGIYVYHFPFIGYWERFLGEQSWWTLPVVSISSALVSLSSWILIESPVLTWKDRPWFRTTSNPSDTKDKLGST